MAQAAGGAPTSNFKVVLLGEGRVGKTSLSLQYVQGKFSPQQQSTVQVRQARSARLRA
jgi:GTPase SAR1 family protein